MKKKFWTSDKVISFSAILISVMTLVVLVYQTNLMRAQQRLSVLPYLSIGRAHTGQANFKFVLTNNGIGPAFVESMKIKHDGKTYDGDFSQFLYNHVPEMDSIHNILHSNVYTGMLIPAGKRINMIEVDNSKEDAIKLLKLMTKLREQELDYELIYRSIYHERWRLTSQSSTPVLLD